MPLVQKCAAVITCLVGLFFMQTAAWGQVADSKPIGVQIPAQSAQGAVKQLARAFRRSLLFQNSELVSVQTNALKGRYSLDEALVQMFKGTRLEGGLTQGGAITVSLRQQAEPPQGEKPVLTKRKSKFFLTTAIASLASTAAIAQDSTVASENTEEIVVVGSQIKGADIAGTLPVTVLTTDDIEVTGAVDGEELFNSIPQVGSVTFNSTGFSGVNGARGDVASINLRSIGTGNTLVLLNGRRLVLHPGTQVENFVPVNSVNTNALPVTGISRIEVLRDGAAALYGTDAVAGVINTVLKDDIEGITTSFQYGGSEGTSLREFTATLEAGFSFNEDRTNISIFGNFLNREGMPTSDLRNSSTEDLRTFFVGTEFEGDTQLRNLSTQTQFAEFRALDGSIDAIGDDDFHIQPDSIAGCAVDLPGPVCADNGGSIDTALRLDRAGFRDLVGDTTRGSVFAFINHEFDGGMEFFGEASYYRANFQREREAAQILSSGRIVVPAANFYNPFGVDLEIRDYRPLDVGRRQVDVDNDSFRILGGLRGQWKEWDWEGAGLYSEATTSDLTGNRVSNTLFQQSLARDTADAYNIFGGGDAVDTNAANLETNSQATIDSITIDVSRRSKTTLALADFKVSNPNLFDLPGGGLGVAVGAEWRRESFLDDRDDRLDGTTTFTDLVTGNTIGSDIMGSSPTPDTSGNRNVYSAFIEVAAPLVSPEMDIPLVESFSIQLAARFESFSDVGDVVKPKVAFSWYPARWLQVRGAYARGFRAPNLEQINATGIRRVNGGREDWITCEAIARANDTAFDVGDCDGTSIESVRAGGPNLEPESNQNFSLGAVFQPTDNLTFTIDYWKIKQQSLVGIFGDQNQISLDYLLRLQGSSNPNVIREEADADTIALFEAAGLTPAGEIVEVADNFTNLNPRDVSGIDLGAFYRLDTMDYGTFNFSFNAAYLDQFFQDPSPQGQALIDGVASGLLNEAVDVPGSESLLEQNGRPQWRWTSSIRWNKGPIGLGAFVRYVGGVDDTSTTSSEGNILRVDSWSTVNLSADYTFEEDSGVLANTRLRVGVRNVTDNDPPLADEFATGYFEELHSNRGRYWYASIRKSF